MATQINDTNDGATAETILPADGARRSIFIDSDQDIWLRFDGVAAANSGIKLKAGLGGYILRSGDFPVKNAISLLGTAACSFQVIVMTVNE